MLRLHLPQTPAREAPTLAYQRLLWAGSRVAAVAPWTRAASRRSCCPGMSTLSPDLGWGHRSQPPTLGCCQGTGARLTSWLLILEQMSCSPFRCPLTSPRRCSTTQARRYELPFPWSSPRGSPSAPVHSITRLPFLLQGESPMATGPAPARPQHGTSSRHISGPALNLCFHDNAASKQTAALGWVPGPQQQLPARGPAGRTEPCVHWSLQLSHSTATRTPDLTPHPRPAHHPLPNRSGT